MQKRGLRITLLLGLCICLTAFLIPGNAVKADGDPVAINETNFPDEVFRNYVAANFDTDEDEALSQEEIEDAKTVSLYGEGCQSLDGIRFLTSLEELDCSGNQLTELDLSGCSSLKRIYCGENQLTSLDISDCSLLEELNCYNNNLTSLDLSNCPELTFLGCGINQLTGLDVSNCPELRELYCYDNNLTSLDISGNENLSELVCWANEISELDVKDCASLIELVCHANDLSTLDISGCTALLELYCYENHITSLTLGNLTELYDLYCDDNQIETLDLSGCPNIIQLTCSRNQLTGLDLSGCTHIQKIECNENELTELNVKNCAVLHSLECSENQLTGLDLTGCSSLERLACCENLLTSVDISDCVNIEQLDVGDNELESIDISKNELLTDFFCQDNHLTELDVSNCPDLIELNCNDNQINSLDLNNLEKLYILKCWNNNLLSLDVSGCINLNCLECPDNKLTNINFGADSKLVSIHCENNWLSEIDFSNCPLLNELNCSGNNLSELDLSNCPKVITAEAYDNALENISLTGCTELTRLCIDNNGLTKLDLSSCISLEHLECNNNLLENITGSTNLTYLGCAKNGLTELNLAGNNMIYLMCWNNNLTNLDLSSQRNLIYLSCDNNELTELDVSNCTKLEELLCLGNALTSLDVSNNPLLFCLQCQNNDIETLDITANSILCDIYATDPVEPGFYKMEIKDPDVEDRTRWGYFVFDPEVEVIAPYVQLSIFSQPSDVSMSVGNTANFIVKAKGKGLIYCWQASKDGGNTWVNSGFTGYNTNTLKVPVTKARTGYMFRCIVKDETGNSVTSEPAKLTVVDELDRIPIDETIFPDEFFRNYLEDAFDYDSDGYLSKDEIADIIMIVYSDTPCRSLEGIKYFTELNFLECRGCQLTALDLEGMTKLEYIDVYNNKLTKINLTGCTALEYLYCDANALTKLDLSGLESLKEVNCFENNLQNINLTGCVSLQDLICFDNFISSLDVSSCPKLNVLNFANNKLTSIDISNNSELFELLANDNEIEYLDISNAPYLCEVYADGQFSDDPYLFYMKDLTINGKFELGQILADLETKIIAEYNAPQFTVQPLDKEAEIGTTADFSVEATGIDLTYQWQTSKDGGTTWVNSKMTGYNTDTLTVSVIADRNGYMFRCVIADIKGVEVISGGAKLKVKSSAVITSQPQDVTTAAGTTVTFSVTATGNGLKYQWQTSKNGGQTWVNSSMTGYKTNTLTVSAIKDRNGYQFRCIITDGNNVSVISEAATLTVTSSAGPEITAQPINVTTTAGSTVTFSITATGTGLKYQWQTSKNGGQTWVNSGMTGYNTNTLTVSAIIDRNGYQFRCVVTDKNGATATSNAAVLKVGSGTEGPQITAQPVNVTTTAGSTVTFSITAAGNGLKYQWQTSKNGGQTWVNSGMTGYNTNTLTVSAIIDRNGYQFRCVVTDKDGATATSNAAVLVVGSGTEGPQITAQPVNVTTTAGSTVTFSITATGSGLKYQWQTSKNGGQTWVNSGMTGYNTNTLTVSAIADRNGYQFRCVVTDKNGATATSNAAVLVVGSGTEGPQITAQPQNVTTAAGSTVTFSITATGSGIKYQWQTSKDGGKTWVNSGMTGYNTNTLTVSAIKDRNGYQFRCVVTDKNGATITSNAAILTVSK